MHVVLKQGHNSGSTVQFLCWFFPPWINGLNLNLFLYGNILFMDSAIIQGTTHNFYEENFSVYQMHLLL